MEEKKTLSLPKHLLRQQCRGAICPAYHQLQLWLWLGGTYETCLEGGGVCRFALRTGSDADTYRGRPLHRGSISPSEKPSYELAINGLPWFTTCSLFFALNVVFV